MIQFQNLNEDDDAVTPVAVLWDLEGSLMIATCDGKLIKVKEEFTIMQIYNAAGEASLIIDQKS